MVILRCVWPLWDFSFRSYEHFKIIICLETIIVTLRRPYWLSIQDISINEILFCQKSNKKSNPTFPTLSNFFRLLDFFKLLDFQTQQPYSESHQSFISSTSCICTVIIIIIITSWRISAFVNIYNLRCFILYFLHCHHHHLLMPASKMIQNWNGLSNLSLPVSLHPLMVYGNHGIHWALFVWDHFN